MINDLRDKGWDATYDTIEIGSLGHVPLCSVEATVSVLPCEQVHTAKDILLNAAKISIFCSQQILAHKQTEWSSTKTLISS